MSQREARRTVLSAADHSYARTLFQLLLSAERHGAHTQCAWTVFDLGLTPGDRATLGSHFPWCRVERFPFDAHPPHVRALASCAWKPVVVDDVLARDGGLVIWLDSASLLHAGLDDAFARVAADGLFTLVGQSPARRWCHPATFECMRTPESDRDRPCRSAGVLGFSSEPPAVRDLVAEWRRLALIPGCLAPPGAGRSNHRYDQAILTNLLHAYARERGLRLHDDEVDISSTRQVRWVSTRNAVAPWVPLAADPLVRAYYAAYKLGDRLVLRARAGLTPSRAR
ncbi:MAG: hypothetical protein HY048_16935 [Acidobacteria bacterium]|nr:hypothetical protein [Acidobacteriota bacterium]